MGIIAIILAFLLGVLTGTGIMEMCVVTKEADKKAGGQSESN